VLYVIYSLRFHEQGGFSLIEVLAAMLLMCIGLLALFSTFGTALLTNVYAAERADAVRLAQEQMEAAKGASFDDIITKSEQVDRNGISYTCRVSVQQTGDDIKDVAVAVAWSSRRFTGGTVQVNLATAVLRR
jgi:prepilin-type N-terminal cleavage/methylation domain-containing protein